MTQIRWWGVSQPAGQAAGTPGEGRIVGGTKLPLTALDKLVDKPVRLLYGIAKLLI
jgi:hypothetical protein